MTYSYMGIICHTDVTIEVEETVVSKGDDVTLHCLVGNRVIVDTFQWFKDGSSIASSNSTPVLTLNNVDAEDGGVYSCLVSGTASSITLYIQPYITAIERTILPDYLVVFTCEAHGFPLPSVNWWRVEERSGVSPVSGEKVLTQPSDDYGTYRCVATTQALNDSAVFLDEVFTGRVTFHLIMFILHAINTSTYLITAPEIVFPDGKLRFYDLHNIPGLQELPREQDASSPPITIPDTLIFGRDIMDTVYVSNYIKFVTIIAKLKEPHLFLSIG